MDETGISYPVSKYFFTVTLHPDLLKRPIKTQLIKSYGPLYRVLKQLFILFEMVFEFTTKSNVHYHGTVTTPKDDEHLIYCFLDLIKGFPYGFNKVDPVKTDNGIDQYIIKDINKTEKICKRRRINLNKYPVIVNHESIINNIPFRIVPLEVIETHKLDILDVIEEAEEEYFYNMYNYQLK